MKKVLLLGYSGFPTAKSAASEKQKLIAKAINMVPGYEVEILNYTSYCKYKYDKKGTVEGVNYRLTAFFSKQPKNRILRVANLVYGYVCDYFYVMFKSYDAIILSTRNSIYILGHILLAKLKQKKVTITIVEDYESLKNDSSLITRLKCFLFFNYVFKYIDGVFPISALIREQARKVNNNLPLLDLPIFTDFEKFERTIGVDERDYFLFCGAAGYFETIKFVIDSYQVRPLEHSLILIINGHQSEIEKVLNYIRKLGLEEKIACKSELSYRNLIGYYKNSAGLLIPLNPDTKDSARFPHKIAEYCASKRPIISSNYGEVKRFFEHKKNALLIDYHDIQAFNKLMQYVEKNKDHASRIGLESYKLGYDKFNYENYGEKITRFLSLI